MEFLQGTAYGNELGASFYNEVYAGNNKEYILADARKSMYYALYCKSLESLVTSRVKNIIEIGCGVGLFAQLLWRTGKFEYKGFDFSEVAINKAKNNVPGFDFYCQDIYTTAILEKEDYDAVVMHEVLEHIEEDIFALSKIRSGTFINASVPNFDSKGHVRYFQTPDQVLNRYAPLIDNIMLEAIPLQGVNILFLLSGNRK